MDSLKNQIIILSPVIGSLLALFAVFVLAVFKSRRYLKWILLGLDILMILIVLLLLVKQP